MLSTADGLEYEKVAALDPDLIIGTNAGLTQESTTRLSGMAPTIAQSGDFSDYFEPWDVQALDIGRALGKEDDVVELVDGILAEFADAARAPGVGRHHGVFLQNAFYDGGAIAYKDGLRTDFLTDLGFVIPAEIDEFSQAEGQAYIPIEKLDVLNNADVLIWGHRGRRRQGGTGRGIALPQTGRGQGRPSGLHRWDLGRRDLLHQSAQPAVRVGRARAYSQTRSKATRHWHRPAERSILAA